MPPVTRLAQDIWGDEQEGAPPRVIQLDCLLPTGVIIPLETPRDATIADIKEELWKEAQNYPLYSLLKDKNSYVFMCVSEHAAKVELDEENRRLSDVRPFQPMLKAVEKKGNRAEKIMNEEIARLIDKSLHEFDRLKSPEVSDFRVRMRTMCEKISRERDSQPWLERLMSQYPPELAPEPALPTHVQDQLKHNMVQVAVQLADTNVSYTFHLSVDAYCEELVQMTLEKRAKNTGQQVAPVTNYVLKVCGREEYFLGPYPLSQFVYLRKMIVKGVKPQLLLVRRETIFDEPPVLPPRGNGTISRRGSGAPVKPPPLPKVPAKKPQASLVTWDIDERYSLTVNGVTNVKDWPDFTKLKLRLCVYHGPSTMCSIFNTSEIMIQEGYANWKEEVTFDIDLPDIPRMARLCFLLYALPEKRGKARPQTGGTPKKKQGGQQKMVPLAWVNIPVFDYRGDLRAGTHKLYMWPLTNTDILSEEFLNPIGTVENNPQVEETVCLELTLPKYNREVPICYPPFEKVLEVAAQHTDLIRSPSSDSSDGTIRETINSVMLKVTSGHLEELRKMIDRDPLDRLHEQDKELVWNLRFECRFHFPQSLPKLLSCVQWNNHEDVAQMQALLQIWEPLPPTHALEMLDFAYADKSVRKFAVGCLKNLSDCELYQYMLQLVQVLKYESYLECDLVEFLLRRAIFNQKIGHCLFWLLRSEMQVPSVSVRFGLILEAYCRGNKQHLPSLGKQVEALGKFQDINDMVKKQKLKEGRDVMKKKLIQNADMFSDLLSMLDPCQKMKQLRIEECSFKDSKMRPLWLVWENTDIFGDSVYIMYKNGDDMRQDMLTLQILKIMDGVWQSDGLDLRLSTYGCLSTGHREGLIEAVTQCLTIGRIQGDSSAFNKECLYQWLLVHNKDAYSMSEAMNEFTLSCAGYCVATYVLGVGDRHSDNIMLKENGQLFHIDFGHILGRFKSKFGVRRERVPFVLTHDFVYVIQRGPKNSSEEFAKFKKLCEQAYLSLRQRSNFLITLFLMMINTGIPEISSVESIEFLKETLVPHLSEEDALHHFRTKFQEALKNSMWAKINFAIHNARRNPNL